MSFVSLVVEREVRVTHKPSSADFPTIYVSLLLFTLMDAGQQFDQQPLLGSLKFISTGLPCIDKMHLCSCVSSTACCKSPCPTAVLLRNWLKIFVNMKVPLQIKALISCSTTSNLFGKVSLLRHREQMSKAFAADTS